MTKKCLSTNDELVPTAARSEDGRLRIRHSSFVIRHSSFVICFLLLSATACLAQTDVLRFRREYAPADRLQDCCARDGAKYLPMEPAQFERLLKVARSSAFATLSRGGRGPALAAVVSAEYRARLDGMAGTDGGRLVDGLATLDVVHLADSVHSAGGETLLPLEPCGLAIGKASWAGDPPQPASLGIGENGILGLRVRRSGKLRFDWSLVGRHSVSGNSVGGNSVSGNSANGAIDFHIELPPCPASKLILDLPENTTPSVTKVGSRQ